METMNIELTRKERIILRKERIKNHFKNNAPTYMAFGVGILTAAATIKRSEIVKVAGDLGEYKTQNTYIVNLENRDNPSKPVKSVDTGEVYASQNRAAQANGIHRGSMSKHLNGQLKSISGKQFVRI